MPDPVYVDSRRTKTAADIVDLLHCDKLIRRAARDISELTATGLVTHRQRKALHFRNLALDELKARREVLLQQVPTI